jgi:hypothetical protein
MEKENSKLRGDIKTLVDDFHRQLDSKESEIRDIHLRAQNDGHGPSNEMLTMLRKENDAYKQESRMLREKVGQLTHELDAVSK